MNDQHELFIPFTQYKRDTRVCLAIGIAIGALAAMLTLYITGIYIIANGY